MKTFLLWGLWVHIFIAVWWVVMQPLLGDMSKYDAIQYGLRRELMTVVALAFYIAWRVTPAREK